MVRVKKIEIKEGMLKMRKHEKKHENQGVGEMFLFIISPRIKINDITRYEFVHNI